MIILCRTLILTFVDDGINIKASGKLQIGTVDILTDSSGTTTLNNIDDLDEYRANMRQHYFSEGPTNRYINREYDFYGDMDDNNSNHLRDRLREISMDDLYNDIFE